MVTLYLFLAAVVLKDVHTFDETCFERLCHGPKFHRSDCCQGFICVALYEPGAEDVLECVDEDEYFRVKSVEEILQELDREFGQSDYTTIQNLEQSLLLDDDSLSKLRDLEDFVFELENFNSPTVVEYRSNNITI